VRETAEGSVEWGTYGKYFLDRQFEIGMDTAVWKHGSPDGTEAFSWRFVKTPPLSGQAGCSASHAPAEGNRGLKSDWERRIDPADGKVYTLQEMRARYAGEYRQRESDSYWEACKMVKPPKDVQVESRIDPADGKIYTWEEVAAHYGSKYSLHQIRDYWDHCSIVSWAMPERRIDPSDCMPYSWMEMKAFYAHDYTISATVAYWDACKKEDAKSGDAAQHFSC